MVWLLESAKRLWLCSGAVSDVFEEEPPREEGFLDVCRTCEASGKCTNEASIAVIWLTWIP